MKLSRFLLLIGQSAGSDSSIGVRLGEARWAVARNVGSVAERLAGAVASLSGSRMPGDSADRLILRGFVFGFVFLLLAKLGGAVKEVVLAHGYGTSSALDAYSLGFAVASWPVALGAMCANTILIPAFVAGLRSPEERDVNVAGLLLRLLPVSVLVAVATYLLLRFGGLVLLPSQELVAALSTQAAGLALMVPPGIAAAVLAAKLMAGRRQISALFEAVPSLFVAACVMTLGAALPAGPLLAWSTGIGMVLYFGALVLADRSVLSGYGSSPQIRIEKFHQNFAIVLLAQIVFTLGGAAFDQVVAATLPQEQNAALAYANRLLMLMTGLGATAIGRAVMPVLSASWATAAIEGRRLLHRWLALLFSGGLLVALAAYALTPWMVRVLFEHGNFTAADTQSVSSLVQVGLLQLPFYFGSLILAQGAVVQRRFGLLLLANILAVAVKLLIVLIFLPRQGVNLLMWGTAAMYFVALVILGSAHFMRRDPT